MRIALDHNLPVKLVEAFSGYDVRHIKSLGFDHLSNGELIARVSESFQILVTADKNMQFQTPLRTSLRVLVLDCPNNRLSTLLGFVPIVEAHFESCAPGEYTVVRLRG